MKALVFILISSCAGLYTADDSSILRYSQILTKAIQRADITFEAFKKIYFDEHQIPSAIRANEKSRQALFAGHLSPRVRAGQYYEESRPIYAALKYRWNPVSLEILRFMHEQSGVLSQEHLNALICDHLVHASDPRISFVLSQPNMSTTLALEALCKNGILNPRKITLLLNNNASSTEAASHAIRWCSKNLRENRIVRDPELQKGNIFAINDTIQMYNLWRETFKLLQISPKNYEFLQHEIRNCQDAIDKETERREQKAAQIRQQEKERAEGARQVNLHRQLKEAIRLRKVDRVERLLYDTTNPIKLANGPNIIDYEGQKTVVDFAEKQSAVIGWPWCGVEEASERRKQRIIGLLKEYKDPA